MNHDERHRYEQAHSARGGGPMTRIHLFWISADGQDSFDGGIHPQDVDRQREEYAFLAELLAQCSDDADRGDIEAGEFLWRTEAGS